LRAPALSKARCNLVLAALVVVLALVSVPAAAQDQPVDIDMFYEKLEPYGQWFEHPVFGTVWRPRVEQDWRPYAHGTWVYTDDFGWYWQAEEPWGWAPFHYGRWLIDADGSWIWIPDTEWGPAWVAWRTSEEYVGWAPLPPEARWGPDGILVFDTEFYSAPRYHVAWCFVRPHQLILPGLSRYLLPHRHAAAVYRQSRPLRAQHRFEGRFINAGFDVRGFERMTGRPVVRVRLKNVDTPQAANPQRGYARGSELSVYQPRFIERAEGTGRINRPAAVGAGQSERHGPGAERDQGFRGGPGERRPAPAATLGRPNGDGEPPSHPAANAEPSGPAARALPYARDRRPDAAPSPQGTTLRQRSPAIPYGEADPGRGPPGGLNPRPYGGPPPGVPRAYGAPQPTARPLPPPSGQGAPPTNLRAPTPDPSPAGRSGPRPEPERRAPPRKDDNKGPG
jgi:hypothetical protein